MLFLNVRRILTLCPTTCAHHSLMIRNLLSDLAGKNLRFTEKLTRMGQRFLPFRPRLPLRSVNRTERACIRSICFGCRLFLFFL